jgi:hypothetical protein
LIKFTPDLNLRIETFETLGSLFTQYFDKLPFLRHQTFSSLASTNDQLPSKKADGTEGGSKWRLGASALEKFSPAIRARRIYP